MAKIQYRYLHSSNDPLSVTANLSIDRKDLDFGIGILFFYFHARYALYRLSSSGSHQLSKCFFIVRILGQDLFEVNSSHLKLG